MSDEPALDRVQRWMLAVITDPRGIAAGLEDAAAQREIPVSVDGIEQVIPRSQACSSLERLAVYGNAYFARLLECLQAEYASVAKAAGEEAFLALAAGYVQAHPPTSYTLGQLGAKFPRYLEQTRPPRAAHESAPDWADFLIDLARLERTYSDVFDGPGEEGEPPLDVLQIQSLRPDQSSDVRLRINRSLQILELRFPVHETYAAIRQGSAWNTPAARETVLAVYRQNYIVQRRPLSDRQRTLLERLRDKVSLGAAIEHTIDRHHLQPGVILDELGGWFRDWTAGGLIAGIGD